MELGFTPPHKGPCVSLSHRHRWMTAQPGDPREGLPSMGRPRFCFCLCRKATWCSQWLTRGFPMETRPVRDCVLCAEIFASPILTDSPRGEGHRRTPAPLLWTSTSPETVCQLEHRLYGIVWIPTCPELLPRPARQCSPGVGCSVSLVLARKAREHSQAQRGCSCCATLPRYGVKAALPNT